MHAYLSSCTLKKQEFKLSRGLDKLTPISPPCLFILCIERLFHMIFVAVDHNVWKPIKLDFFFFFLEKETD